MAEQSHSSSGWLSVCSVWGLLGLGGCLFAQIATHTQGCCYIQNRGQNSDAFRSTSMGSFSPASVRQAQVCATISSSLQRGLSPGASAGMLTLASHQPEPLELQGGYVQFQPALVQSVSCHLLRRATSLDGTCQSQWRQWWSNSGCLETDLEEHRKRHLAGGWLALEAIKNMYEGIVALNENQKEGNGLLKELIEGQRMALRQASQNILQQQTRHHWWLWEARGPARSRQPFRIRPRHQPRSLAPIYHSRQCCQIEARERRLPLQQRIQWHPASRG